MEYKRPVTCIWAAASAAVKHILSVKICLAENSFNVCLTANTYEADGYPSEIQKGFNSQELNVS